MYSRSLGDFDLAVIRKAIDSVTFNHLGEEDESAEDEQNDEAETVGDETGGRFFI